MGPYITKCILFVAVLFSADLVYAQSLEGGFVQYRFTEDSLFVNPLVYDYADVQDAPPSSLLMQVDVGENLIEEILVYREGFVTVRLLPSRCFESGVPGFSVREVSYGEVGISLDSISDEGVKVGVRVCCANLNQFENISNDQSSEFFIYAEILPEGTEVPHPQAYIDIGIAAEICQGENIERYIYVDDSTSVGLQTVYNLTEPLLFEDGVTVECEENIQGDSVCNFNLTPFDYSSVSYNVNNPFGSENNVFLNPNTGELNGFMNGPGQYLFAINIDTYLNGVLLSRVRAMSMVGVYFCEKKIEAIVEENVQSQSSVFKACIGGVELRNFSKDSLLIDSVEWIIESEVVSREWNLNHTFDRSGEYGGMLIVNPNTSCVDTAKFVIIVNENPQAAFTSTYDPCVAGPVAYYDRSTGGTPPYSYAWQLGDGLTDSLAAPVAQYTAPGIFPAALAVADANGCADTLTRPVDYRPAPAVLVVAPSARTGCPPLPVTFDNLSVPVDTTYTVTWDFGDGATGAAISPRHTYRDTGTYDVALRIESPVGCLIDTVFRELVHVVPNPSAAFRIDPEVPTSLDPAVRLSALDPTPPRHEWRADGAVIGEGPTLDHELTAGAPETITLVVTNTAYCQDTMSRTVQLAPAATYHLPNAFTPNADGRNELFRGVGATALLTDFSLVVYDRYGGQVFLTADPAQGWDGTHGGRALPQGAYVWRLRYTVAGRTVEESGSVLLVR